MIGARQCCDRIAWRARESRATGRARIIPRDFRSVYSLAGHSFLPVTFAALRQGAGDRAQRAPRRTIAARCPRRGDNKVSTFADPGAARDDFRVMLVRTQRARSLCNCRIMPRRVRTRSERRIDQLARIESRYNRAKIISCIVEMQTTYYSFNN